MYYAAYLRLLVDRVIWYCYGVPLWVFGREKGCVKSEQCVRDSTEDMNSEYAHHDTRLPRDYDVSKHTECNVFAIFRA